MAMLKSKWKQTYKGELNRIITGCASNNHWNRCSQNSRHLASQRTCLKLKVLYKRLPERSGNNNANIPQELFSFIGNIAANAAMFFVL